MAPPHAPELIFRDYWVPTEEIHYLRFLLEGYDGLLTLRCRPGSCLVSVEIPENRWPEARSLIQALSREIGLRAVPRVTRGADTSDDERAT